MIMIIGGEFQGKTDYAKSVFGFRDEEILDGEKCDIDAVFSAKCINKFHKLVERILEKNDDPARFCERLCKENKSAVIIMNEVGCGIIPLEKSDRILRENVGKSGCIIAKNSEKVIRIFCGIPEKIKGELP